MLDSTDKILLDMSSIDSESLESVRLVETAPENDSLIFEVKNIFDINFIYSKICNKGTLKNTSRTVMVYVSFNNSFYKMGYSPLNFKTIKEVSIYNDNIRIGVYSATKNKIFPLRAEDKLLLD